MSPLVVLRCNGCGDTFSTEEDDVSCPSCGSRELVTASEPPL